MLNVLEKVYFATLFGLTFWVLVSFAQVMLHNTVGFVYSAWNIFVILVGGI